MSNEFSDTYPPIAPTTETGKTAFESREVWLIGVLFVAQFTLLVDFLVIVPLGASMMKGISLTPLQYGCVAATASLSAGLSCMFLTKLLDRWPRLSAILIFYGVYIFGTIITALGFSLPNLIVGRCIAGLSSGLLAATTLSLIGERFPTTKQGQVTGIIMSAFGLASLLGVPLSTTIGIHYGWRTPLVCVVSVAAMNWLVIAWLFRSESLILHDNVGQLTEIIMAGASSVFTEQVAVKLDCQSKRCLQSIAMLVFAAFMVVPYLPPYITGNLMLPEKWLPIIYMFAGALTLVAVPAASRWGDRIGLQKILVWSVCFSGITLCFLASLPSKSAYLTTIVVSSVAALNTLRLTLVIAMLNRVTSSDARSQVMAWNIAIQNFGAAFGAIVGGLILFGSDQHTLNHFFVLCMTSTIIAISALPLCFGSFGNLLANGNRV